MRRVPNRNSGCYPGSTVEDISKGVTRIYPDAMIDKIMKVKPFGQERAIEWSAKLTMNARPRPPACVSVTERGRLQRRHIVQGLHTSVRSTRQW